MDRVRVSQYDCRFPWRKTSCSSPILNVIRCKFVAAAVVEIFSNLVMDAFRLLLNLCAILPVGHDYREFKPVLGIVWGREPK